MDEPAAHPMGASKSCCSKWGIFRDADVGAQRTRATPGDHARARRCVKWTFLCTRRSGCDSGLPIASLCLAKFSKRFVRVLVRGYGGFR